MLKTKTLFWRCLSKPSLRNWAIIFENSPSTLMSSFILATKDARIQPKNHLSSWATKWFSVDFPRTTSSKMTNQKMYIALKISFNKCARNSFLTCKRLMLRQTSKTRLIPQSLLENTLERRVFKTLSFYLRRLSQRYRSLFKTVMPKRADWSQVKFCLKVLATLSRSMIGLPSLQKKTAHKAILRILWFTKSDLQASTNSR